MVNNFENIANVQASAFASSVTVVYLNTYLIDFSLSLRGLTLTSESDVKSGPQR